MDFNLLKNSFIEELFYLIKAAMFFCFHLAFGLFVFPLILTIFTILSIKELEKIYAFYIQRYYITLPILIFGIIYFILILKKKSIFK
jgi:hypothetical protein